MTLDSWLAWQQIRIKRQLFSASERTWRGPVPEVVVLPVVVPERPVVDLARVKARREANRLRCQAWHRRERGISA
jgi:hypothetical protein